MVTGLLLPLVCSTSAGSATLVQPVPLYVHCWFGAPVAGCSMTAYYVLVPLYPKRCGTTAMARLDATPFGAYSAILLLPPS